MIPLNSKHKLATALPERTFAKEDSVPKAIVARGMPNIPEAKLEDLRGTPTKNVLTRVRVLALFSSARKVEFHDTPTNKIPASSVGGTLLTARRCFAHRGCFVRNRSRRVAHRANVG